MVPKPNLSDLMKESFAWKNNPKKLRVRQSLAEVGRVSTFTGLLVSSCFYKTTAAASIKITEVLVAPPSRIPLAWHLKYQFNSSRMVAREMVAVQDLSEREEATPSQDSKSHCDEL